MVSAVPWVRFTRDYEPAMMSWSAFDHQVGRLAETADELRYRRERKQPVTAEAVLARIDRHDRLLQQVADDFAASLSDSSRWLHDRLAAAELAATVLLLSTGVSLALVLVGRVEKVGARARRSRSALPGAGDAGRGRHLAAQPRRAGAVRQSRSAADVRRRPAGGAAPVGTVLQRREPGGDPQRAGEAARRRRLHLRGRDPARRSQRRGAAPDLGIAGDRRSRRGAEHHQHLPRHQRAVAGGARAGPERERPATDHGADARVPVDHRPHAALHLRARALVGARRWRSRSAARWRRCSARGSADDPGVSAHWRALQGESVTFEHSFGRPRLPAPRRAPARRRWDHFGHRSASASTSPSARTSRRGSATWRAATRSPTSSTAAASRRSSTAR